MKHFFALPALLRPALLLAAASQHTFSVQDDLLAFPQYEVHFSDEYYSELQAEARLQSSNRNDDAHDDDVGSQVQAFQHGDNLGSDGEGARKKEKIKLSYETLTLQGQQYLCSIPQLPKHDSSSQRSANNASNTAQAKVEEERELTRANDRGWELLQGMEGNCVFFISGWWSYRFCYKDGVKQFHQLPPGRGVPPFPPIEDPGVEGYMLGQFKEGEALKPDDLGKQPMGRISGDNGGFEGALEVSEHAKRTYGRLGELVQRGESRYLVQRLEGGTVCDLTGKERRIEVQFHCNPQTTDRISLIKETSTCAYLMIIQTPRLCSDVAFLPPQKDAPNRISCHPILGSDEEIAHYEDDLKLLREAEEEARIWLENADAAEIFLGSGPSGGTHGNDASGLVVGDIVIGGHALVPEGHKIEKSAIVGGGKETYVDTIANSAGKLLDRAALEKLGLGNEKAIEKLKEEIQKFAEGAAWKLDVVDTPRGREYRGIVGDDAEDDKQKEDGGKKGDSKEADGDKKGKKAGATAKSKDKKREGSEEEYFKKEEL